MLHSETYRQNTLSQTRMALVASTKVVGTWDIDPHVVQNIMLHNRPEGSYFHLFLKINYFFLNTKMLSGCCSDMFRHAVYPPSFPQKNIWL